jgi:hypothetical protein
MFGTLYGFPPTGVPQSLRSDPVYSLLRSEPMPAVGTGVPVSNGLPALLLGHGATEQLLGRSLKPLDTQLDERTWWAYSPQEDAAYFIRQVEAFLKVVPKVLRTGIAWRGLDPLVHGPATADGLWAVLTPAPGSDWLVFEHRLGWSWWNSAEPGVVSGIGADAYHAHCGVRRADIRAWLRSRARYYVVDNQPKRVTTWFISRFGYDAADVVRLAPWLMHLQQLGPI